MSPAGIVLSAITLLSAGYTLIKKHNEELRQAADNSANTFAHSKTTLDGYVSQIQELKGKLDSGTLSESEAYEAKKQLVDIQTQLNQTYGDAAKGLDLINGATEVQIEAAKELALVNAQNFLNDPKNLSQMNTAIEKMEGIMGGDGNWFINPGTYLGTFYDSLGNDAEKLKSILSKYGENIKLDSFDDGSFRVRFVGNVEEAREVLGNLMTDIRHAKDEFSSSLIFDDIFIGASNAYKEAGETIEKYGNIYRQAKEARMIDESYGANKKTYNLNGVDQTAVEILDKYTTSIQNYNDAIMSGDSSKIAAASSDFESLDAAIKGLFANNPDFLYFKSIFDGVEEQLNKAGIALNKAGEKFKNGDLAKSLKNLKLTDVDLMAALQTDGFQTGETLFNALCSGVQNVYKEMGLIPPTAEQCISLFTEWGIVSQVSSEAAADAVKEVSYALEDVATRTQEYIDQQSALQSAFSSMNSATGMTAEEISKVTTEFQKLDSFDPALLFETTAHGVRMNTEAFKAYNQQLQAQNKADILEAIILKQRELNALEADNPGRAALESEIQQLGLLASQYDAVTSKYNAYVNATSSANNRDSFANVASGYSAVQALLEQGWVSDDSVTSYLDLMLGENWRTDFADAKSAFGSISKSVNEFGHSLKDYMTFDGSGELTSQGIWKFAEDAAKLGFGSIEDDIVTLDLTGDNIYKLADALGTTAEFAELMGRALADAGMNITFDPQDVMDYNKAIRELNKQAAESQEKLKQLKEESEGGILGEVNLDYDAAEMGIDDIRAKIKELKDAKVSLDVETDSEAINAIDEQIAELEKREIMLSIGAAIDGGKTVDELLAMSDEDLQTTLNIDTSQVAAARELIESISSLNPEVPITVKLDESQLNALITGTPIEVTPVVDGEVDVPDTTVMAEAIVEDAPHIPDATVKATVVGNPTASPATTSTNVEGTVNYKLGKYPKTVPPVTGVANYSAKYNYSMTAPTIYGKAVYEEEHSETSGGSRASGTMMSIAHADGTAYNVTNLQRVTPSHASGRVALEHDETALTNEVG